MLAFNALPIVLLMSVLTTLLFYWGILPPIVRGFALALNRTMGVGGAVGLSTAANIFVGHVEAPLFIRPYLAKLSRSELFVVMTGGMAGIAGTVLVLYAQFLATEHSRRRRPSHHRLGAGRAGRGADRPDHGAGRARHAAPTSLDDRRAGRRQHHGRHRQGRDRGLALLLNMIAMLIVFVALVHLVNAMLGAAAARRRRADHAAAHARARSWRRCAG